MMVAVLEAAAQAVRRHRVGVALTGSLVIFGGALLLWVRGPSEPAYSRGFAPIPKPVVTAPSSRPATPSATPTPAMGTTRAGAPSVLDLPPLPVATDADPSGLPRHSVKLTITSDRDLLRYGYRVAYGKPAAARGMQVHSPLIVTTVGRSYGLIAVVGGQADPDATYITCTITVDGRQRVTRTVHGGWSVAVCVG